MELAERSLHFGTDQEIAESLFACPGCGSRLEVCGADLLRCPKDANEFKREENIWRFLLPERRQYYEQFMREYATIREREGRGSHDPAFYRALPFKDLSGRFTSDWQIRAVSYTTFVEKVLTPFHKKAHHPLHILDLGAGNAWLSNRLKQSGHAPVAMDLLTNSLDGLGATAFYRHPFTLVQAEIDRLPFFKGLFDMAIFNASLHYSENYEVTLSEALQVLNDDGRLVILDTPIYHDADSGKQMVEEREATFAKEFGFRSNAVRNENFLTFDRLKELAEQLNLHWQFIKPPFGLKWQVKPLVAKLRMRREPAKFLVLVGRSTAKLQ